MCRDVDSTSHDRPSDVARPLANFVPNQGQWPDTAQFRARFGPVTVFLEDGGWTLSRSSSMHGDAAVRMRLVDAAPVRLTGEGRRRGHHNYLLGSDPARWRTGVPLYASVLYQSPLSGVDLRAYSKDGHFEYDLLLSPGTDLSGIEMIVDGASELRLSDDGALIFETAIGPITQQPPITWQDSPSGGVQQLACRYVLTGHNRFGFTVPDWDGATPLTVDPGLVWSTFLGGPGIGLPFDDVARGVSVDSNGIVTVVGSTTSINFPTTVGAYNTSSNGGNLDVYIARFDPARVGAAELVYSTFLGGIGDDLANHCTVDSNGVVTLAGTTDSSTFPTTNGAFDTTYSGGARDIFVARVDPSRTGPAQLEYSTLFGGSGTDVCTALHVDPLNVATLTGRTSSSSDFPTSTGAFSPGYNGGSYDAFVAVLDTAGAGSAQLVYSTFLGGINTDLSNDVSVDASGVVTVTGSSESPDFPTTANAYNTSFNGGRNDAFVTRLDPGLSGSAQLVYSTFLGGPDSEQANALAVETSGLITVTGITDRDTFPTTPNAYDSTFNGGAWDAFIAQLDPSLGGTAQLRYSTLIGGSTGDYGLDVIVDSSGAVTITGEIGADNSTYPTTAGAFDRTHGGGGGDAYVSRLDFTRTGTSQLIYSTFVGAGRYERSLCMSAHGNGVVIAGTTTSSLFPTTTGAYSTAFNGGSGDAFVTHLDLLPTGVTAFGTSSPGCAGPVWIGVTSLPSRGNGAFSITSVNAPANALGAMFLSTGSLPVPAQILRVNLWVDLGAPSFALPVTSNAKGAAEFVVPIPATTPVGVTLAAQYLWSGPSSPPPCPTLGLSASNGLNFTIQ